MELVTTTYLSAYFEDAANVTREQVLHDIDLQAIADFLYPDVRALPYAVRHGLLDYFPKPKLFDSGRSALWGRRTFTEEERANLVFNLFCRALKRLNFRYQSGQGASFFCVSTRPVAEEGPFVRPRRGGPVVARGERFGVPALLGECSCLSWSLCQVFIAFGFDAGRVGTEAARVDEHGRLAIHAKPELLERYNAIFGTDIECPLDSRSLFDPNTKAGCERYTAPVGGGDSVEEYFSGLALAEFEKHRGGKTFSQNWRGLDSALKHVAATMQSRLTNTVAVGEVGVVEPTVRQVFDNHLCAFVLPEPREGAARPPRWRANHFDPLFALRFSNGLPDFFEEYQRTREQGFRLAPISFAPKEDYITLEYASVNNPRRRLTTLPRALDANYLEACAARREAAPVNWEEGLVTIDDLPKYLLTWLTFDYDEGPEAGEKANGLNFFQFYRRRHPEIFIVSDERDRAKDKEGEHWVIAWLRERVAGVVERNQSEADRESKRARPPRVRSHSVVEPKQPKVDTGQGAASRRKSVPSKA